jgi:hypothetical protein
MQQQNENNFACILSNVGNMEKFPYKIYRSKWGYTLYYAQVFPSLFRRLLKTASLRPQTKLTRLLWVWNPETNLLELVQCRVRWNVLADMYELPIGLYVHSVIYITLITIFRKFRSSKRGILFCWIFNRHETSVSIEDSRKPECKAFCGKKETKTFCKIREENKG